MSNIRTISIPANGLAVETLTGRFFAVISATGGFTVEPAGAAIKLPMVTGRKFGSADAPPFNRLVFTDTSGSINSVTFYAGDVPYEVSETTSGMTIAAADVISITPAAVTHTCDFEDVSNASTAFASKKSISITNTGAVDCTVNCGGLGERTLASGDDVSFTVLRMQDSLPSITVDTTGGGGGVARVAWLA